MLSFLSKPSSSGRSYEAIEVHHAGRVVHAVRSDSHTHRDAVADLVWYRADQSLNSCILTGSLETAQVSVFSLRVQIVARREDIQ